MKKIIMTKNGVSKEIKDGISYTFFFFGFYVPLFRGQLKESILVFVLNFITSGFSHFYFVFKINERYKNNLLKNGWIIEKEISLSTGLEILKGIVVILLILLFLFILGVAVSGGAGIKKN